MGVLNTYVVKQRRGDKNTGNLLRFCNSWGYQIARPQLTSVTATKSYSKGKRLPYEVSMEDLNFWLTLTIKWPRSPHLNVPSYNNIDHIYPSS